MRYMIGLFLATGLMLALRHSCIGLTGVVTELRGRPGSDAVASSERSLLFGPRRDSGGPDGTGFVRILAGVRQLAGVRRHSNDQSASSVNTLGVGVGFGASALDVLFDVNWVMSPWNEHDSQRLTFSFGYLWSFPLRRGS